MTFFLPGVADGWFCIFAHLTKQKKKNSLRPESRVRIEKRRRRWHDYHGFSRD